MRILCQPGVEPIPARDRCTGECCKSFPLPFTWDEWAAMVRGDIPKPYQDEAGGADQEVAMIISMVRPNQNDPRNGGNRRYTCTLFDGESCQAYSARPHMCRHYPYDKPCEHGGRCASKDARAGRLGYRHHLPVL